MERSQRVPHQQRSSGKTKTVEKKDTLQNTYEEVERTMREKWIVSAAVAKRLLDGVIA